MATTTSIEWTDTTWNPIRGCSIVSKGCTNCYAMKQAHRFSGPGKPYEGLTTLTNGGPVWTGKVRLVPELLDAPLRWRKPRRVFVNSMSDLFHEDVPDEFIDQVFAVMALARAHTFQVLTKRPGRMRDYLASRSDTTRDKFSSGHLCSFIVASELWRFDACPTIQNPQHHLTWERIGWSVWSEARPRGEPERQYITWPLPNVWLGVSVEDQATADERIPLLLETPAAVRFVSAEPLLGPVDLENLIVSMPARGEWCFSALSADVGVEDDPPFHGSVLNWVIVGGESGPGARPCDVDWIRGIVRQCESAAVPVFVKQLGARVIDRNDAGFEGCSAREWPDGTTTGDSEHYQGAPCRIRLRNLKGADPAEWPADLRVREMP